MKVLELNRKILRWLGMCLERDASHRDYYQSFLTNLFFLALFSIYIQESALYFFNNMDKMSEAVTALMVAIAFFQLAGIYISFIWNKSEIFDFFGELQQFVDESKLT